MFKKLYDKIKIGKAEGGFRILHRRKTIILNAVTKKELIEEKAFAWRFKVKVSAGRGVYPQKEELLQRKCTGKFP